MRKNAVYFVAGAAVGALAAWFVAKKKYEKITQEEIKSVTDAFSERLDKFSRNSMQDPNIKPPSDELEQYETKPGDRDVFDYAAILSKQGYTDYTQYSRNEEPTEEKDEEKESDSETDAPMIISPLEYGENESYERLSWIYFFDRVLTDDDYAIITDRDKWIGPNALQHFGDYEDDAIHVRNDKLKCYIEIVQDSRLYASVVAEKNSY